MKNLELHLTNSMQKEGNTKKLFTGIILAISAVTLCFCLFGCGNGEQGQGSSNGSKEPAKDSIKVESLDVETSMTNIEGESCMGVTYKNGSTFTIASININYDFKDDVTDKQIQDAYGSHIDGKWITLEDIKKKEKRADFDIPLEPGKKSNECPIGYNFTIGNTQAVDSQTQFDLLQPTKMQIMFKANGSNLYLETYDYKNKTYGLSSKVIDLNSWPDSDLGKVTPKPSNEYTIVKSSSNTYLSVNVLDASSSDFSNYVKQCKNAGFTNISTDSEKSFSAKTADGKYWMSASYTPYTKKIEISVNGK